MSWLGMAVVLISSLFRGRIGLAAENLALRQQLSVSCAKAKKPRLRNRDRIFCVWLSRLWADWRSVLVIVEPETIVRWYRQGFRLYWRWKSRSKPGRPRIDRELRKLIRQMCRENPTWGAPRIHSEILLLGYDVAQATVETYMVRRRTPPSLTWRAFVDNHLGEIVAVDFFAVPTATFRILFAFVVLRYDRRFFMHFNATGIRRPSGQLSRS